MISLSGAYREGGFAGWLEKEGVKVQMLDFEGLEGTSCYCDEVARMSIERALPSVLPSLRWIDSGDYHYLTHILALRETEPFHLVLMDHHPDCQPSAFGDMLSCGGWVETMKKGNPMLRDVLSIGPEGCPEDIPEGWLEERRGERLYVSLDKDIMSGEFARTDWTQGSHTPAMIEDMLRRMMEMTEVVAIDICGEMPPPKGATPEDRRINLETNIELFRYVTERESRAGA